MCTFFQLEKWIYISLQIKGTLLNNVAVAAATTTKKWQQANSHNVSLSVQQRKVQTHKTVQLLCDVCVSYNVPDFVKNTTFLSSRYRI